MDTLLDRVSARIQELGLSDRAVSLLATGDRNETLVRDMRRRGTRVQGDQLEALAEALETTVEYLRYGSTAGVALQDRRTGYEARPQASPFDKPLPRDLPVYGTALGTETAFDQDRIETHVVELTDAIDWVRRPPSLDGRRDVYALYITGSSMEPRYEPGDPVIVDPKRPPSPGDDVIVQILDGRDPEVKLALVKRLVRRTAQYLELRQYNPSSTFQVPLDRVAAVHRVLAVRDLIG